MALRPPPPGLQLPMRVWDGPTRLFHWAIVLLVTFSYVSIRLGWMDWHMRSGEAVLALLIFRLAWGVVGSQTARFSQFLRGPGAVLGHLRHFARREPDTQVGHNAAGGWMVLAMLGLLLAQAVSGLFANDVDAFVTGPLAGRVSDATGTAALALHYQVFTFIKIIVVLHVAAVLAYAVVKRHNLVRPMITGKKRLPAATRAPRMASPVLAAALFVAAAALVWVVVTKL
ncbi:MAG: hypothetical protein BGP12_17515 [Rhodospirillales bacterium 70-18]|nr:cytochrome b/b6 domain-containing protein [Rhodospirillales bacterium]OJY65655.1 MAG: hypothetical protein BGP12_17515 [Rhodospirillales bacterium 70-18]